ncbi:MULTISPECIES: SDR family NAD(P)-dependent oxidoreductase [Chelativorans]|jgi:3-oxoacyl-[acyl-carrier protein] reductase|uniref:Short-chain dehydrogenase/reductase SDR n=1 Tax=Chelativorans sp. (strain BNC1) TaxID=266779 RepID=Q11LB0_CHESB|nr:MULTISPECIES: SDR family NAD(P)-dependent oxidoreductase [Chelativorans]
MNLIDLKGRKAIITGGSGGIGLAVARRMIASGAEVALWDLASESLRQAKAELDNVATVSVDVTSESDVERATQETAAKLGGIDILVNAAGIGGVRSTVAQYPVEAWRKIIEVNLTGTFLCCRSVVREMEKTGYGRIVNISSIAGKEGNPFGSAYSAAKAAVISLTKSLAKELLATEIRVNCVTPAAVETELFQKMSPESQSASRERIPLGRLGRPEEIAAMIVWMCSEECSFTTGAVFDLSGGRATY